MHVHLRCPALGLSRGRGRRRRRLWRRYGQRLAGRCRLGWLAGRLLVADLEDRCSLGQLQAAVDQIGDDDSAGDLGRQQDQGDEIFLAFNQRLGHTVDGVAAIGSAHQQSGPSGGLATISVFVCKASGLHTR
jgi:hypothetical protein